jgi:threonine dehydrogenase-like Zn-dependent dehydrogenase
MKAVVFHAVGDIRVDDVPEPKLQAPTDAIIRLTSSAICGTDLHFVRGTMPGMKPGTVLGHEGVGVVEQLGQDVRNLDIGDRVVVCSTIACGTCSYCRAGYYAQCDNANPHGKRAGTAFFGGPVETGPFNGLQAEKARIPFANVGLVKLPDEVTDDQAILLSDIFPTGYFGADLAEVKRGDTVAVFGCGPVGQFAIASAWLKGASRIIAIDKYEDRLAMARRQGAEVVNFEREDPVAVVVRLTGGIGVDRVIDAVGVDAVHAHHGPATQQAAGQRQQFEQERRQVAPVQLPRTEPGYRATRRARRCNGLWSASPRPAHSASLACTPRRRAVSRLAWPWAEIWRSMRGTAITDAMCRSWWSWCGSARSTRWRSYRRLSRSMPRSMLIGHSTDGSPDG